LLQECPATADLEQVSLFTTVRRARAAVAVALGAGLLAASPVVLTPAHAETTGQASAHAQAVLARVHTIQAEAKAAEQRYQAVFASVSESVNRSITDDQASSAIADHADAAQATFISRVQGLYESGGQLAAAASLLTSGSLTQFYEQSVLARSVVKQQVSGVQAADSHAQSAQQAAKLAVKRSHAKIGTERTVAAAATRVGTLLAQQTTLLKQADNHLAAVRKAQAALAAEAASFSSITAASIAGLQVLPPSAQYLALYKAAAPTCAGLSWTILAAIGQVETGHGRDTSTSSAGAEGPMQFEPATFAAYAVDGDGDGVANINDPADAIYTAAHYLCANGAGISPSALNGAILHYNHAVWYLDMVLKLAGEYATAYP
jgi:membrane-bound lytic murein transglycosylase B